MMSQSTASMDKQTPLSVERQLLLAKRLRGRAGSGSDSRQILTRGPGETAPLSAAQHQLWVADQMKPGNPAYNVPVAYRVLGELDLCALETSLNRIVQRHEILRTS